MAEAAEGRRTSLHRKQVLKLQYPNTTRTSAFYIRPVLPPLLLLIAASFEKVVLTLVLALVIRRMNVHHSSSHTSHKPKNRLFLEPMAQVSGPSI